MPPSPAASQLPPLHRVERVARWLDEAIRIPGTRIRVGLDALIGMIPVVGDAAGLALGGWLIYEAHQLGTPLALKLKMARNVLIDALAGLVPVLGDIVDVAFRSNRRNLELLRGHFQPDAAVAAPRLTAWIRLALLLAAGLLAWWFYRR